MQKTALKAIKIRDPAQVKEKILIIYFVYALLYICGSHNSFWPLSICEYKFPTFSLAQVVYATSSPVACLKT